MMKVFTYRRENPQGSKIYIEVEGREHAAIESWTQGAYELFKNKLVDILEEESITIDYIRIEVIPNAEEK